MSNVHIIGFMKLQEPWLKIHMHCCLLKTWDHLASTHVLQNVKLEIIKSASSELQNLKSFIDHIHQV